MGQGVKAQNVTLFSAWKKFFLKTSILFAKTLYMKDEGCNMNTLTKSYGGRTDDIIT